MNDTIINMIIIENGNAPIIAAVCKEDSPPILRKIQANEAIIIPHNNFILLGGFKEPFDESMEITNVAESAEVTKKIEINSMPKSVVKFEK